MRIDSFHTICTAFVVAFPVQINVIVMSKCKLIKIQIRKCFD